MNLNLKVILVGNEAVGKTTILHRFTDNEFTKMQATVSAAFRCKLCQYKQYRVTLGIWDTAGQQKFDNTVFYKRAKVALICYDITNKKTFENLHRFVNVIRKEAEPNCLFAIVGTKHDLGNMRQVPYDRAKALAKEVGAAFALETSAKNGFQVNDVFHRVISTYVDTYLERPITTTTTTTTTNTTTTPSSTTSTASTYSNETNNTNINDPDLSPTSPTSPTSPSFPHPSASHSTLKLNHSSSQISQGEGSNYIKLEDGEEEEENGGSGNSNHNNNNNNKDVCCTCKCPCIIL